MTSTITLSPSPHTHAPFSEHAWLVESRHATSEGTVLYVACSLCGIRRVDLQPHPHLPPSALSATLGDVTR